MSRMRRTEIARRWTGSRWGRAVTHHRRLDLATYTLAMAAQLVLCAAPLLVAVSAILRKLHQGSMAAVLADYLSLDQEARKDIYRLFSPSAPPTWTDLLVGFVVAFLFATGLAATSQRVFERLWSVPRADWRAVWRQMTWAAALVPLFVGAAWSSFQTRSWSISRPVEIALEALTVGIVAGLVYWWTQHFLLGGRIHWRRLLSGAVYIGTGVGLTEAAAQLLVPGQVTDEVDDYGLVGATFVLSAWALVLAGVIVAGALLGYATDEAVRHRRKGEPAGLRAALAGGLSAVASAARRRGGSPRR